MAGASKATKKRSAVALSGLGDVYKRQTMVLDALEMARCGGRSCRVCDAPTIPAVLRSCLAQCRGDPTKQARARHRDDLRDQRRTRGGSLDRVALGSWLIGVTRTAVAFSAATYGPRLPVALHHVALPEPQNGATHQTVELAAHGFSRTWTRSARDDVRGCIHSTPTAVVMTGQRMDGVGCFEERLGTWTNCVSRR